MRSKNGRKRPLLALVLSGILPGLGQIYNGENQKGLILVVLNFVINYLLQDPMQRFMEKGFTLDRPTLVVFMGYTVAGLILWLYAMIDAKRTAESINMDIDNADNDSLKS